MWLRWSWRDLKGRKGLVVAIAAVIAIGTGMQTGLGSMEAWRKQSNDRSYELLRAHDLKVELAESSFGKKGRLLSVLREMLDRVGLAERAAHFPHELLGGEQQR